jgi:DNA-binding transcriptional LysR family regulator
VSAESVSATGLYRCRQQLKCASRRTSGNLRDAPLKVDLAIGPHSQWGERFSHQLLLKDEFVAVLRKNHSATKIRELTAENFSDLPQLEISSARHATDFIDEALGRSKLARRIALRAPFLSAVRILVSSDMVSVLPRRIAEELVRYRPLAIRALPFSSPVIERAMIWPRWLDNQPAHGWLRNIVAGVSRELDAR